MPPKTQREEGAEKERRSEERGAGSGERVWIHRDLRKFGVRKLEQFPRGGSGDVYC